MEERESGFDEGTAREQRFTLKRDVKKIQAGWRVGNRWEGTNMLRFV